MSLLCRLVSLDCARSQLSVTSQCPLIVTVPCVWVFGCQIVNHHLLKDLTSLGLWNDSMKTLLISDGGSVQVFHTCDLLFFLLVVLRSQWQLVYVEGLMYSSN